MCTTMVNDDDNDEAAPLAGDARQRPLGLTVLLTSSDHLMCP